MTESDWALVACALISFVTGLLLGTTVACYLMQDRIRKLAAALGIVAGQMAEFNAGAAKQEDEQV